MHAPRTIELPVSEPPAALLARFDRLLPRNLALPPDVALAHPLSVAGLREALACRRRPAGPRRSLSSHLLVGLPCDTGPGGDRALAAIFRELRELADALGSAHDVARVTFRACNGMTKGDRRLGIVLDSVRARFRASNAEVCVEVQRVDSAGWGRPSIATRAAQRRMSRPSSGTRSRWRRWSATGGSISRPSRCRIEVVAAAFEPRCG